MLMDDELPPLTDDQVQIGALPGESWEDARCRLEAERVAYQWPVLTSDDSRPEYLRRLEVRPERGAASKSLALWQAEQRATQHLSAREQFQQRTGATWPSYAECVAKLPATELEWVACAERLPDVDDTALRYWVHTPSNQRLTCCRYVGDGMWSRLSDGSLLSGSRHWRIAPDDKPGSRSVTRAECYALARLSRLHKLPPFEDVYDEQDAWPWLIHLLNRSTRCT